MLLNIGPAHPAMHGIIRIQTKLEGELIVDSNVEIGYLHRPDLAPTTELRRLQYREDDRAGVGKRSRSRLAPEYARRYTSEILNRADLGSLLAALPADGVAALLCVERDPEACHRSLIAERLRCEHGLRTLDLLP